MTELAGHLRRSPEGSKRDCKPPKCRRLPALEEQRHDGDEDTGTIADTVGHDDCDYERTEARATIARLASILSDRDREVLGLRFEHGVIQSEIAEHVGCSQMHVSRILKKSLDGMALEARLPGAQRRRAAYGGPPWIRGGLRAMAVRRSVGTEPGLHKRDPPSADSHAMVEHEARRVFRPGDRNTNYQ